MPLSRGSTRERLLRDLKLRGPCTATALAARLHLTPTAVRLHLSGLARAGLARARPVRRGVGRPAGRWDLTAAAEALFPDGHPALCVALAEALMAALPPAQRRRVVASLVRRDMRRYRQLIPARAGIWSRLRALARLRNAEGYMAEARREGGTLRLIENHCPVGQAAAAFPEICDAEIRVLRGALGQVDVAIEEHRLGGSRRCVLCVSPRRAKRARSGRRRLPG